MIVRKLNITEVNEIELKYGEEYWISLGRNMSSKLIVLWSSFGKFGKSVYTSVDEINKLTMCSDQVGKMK